MTSDAIVASVLSRYPGVVEVSSWGERSVFYNPGRVLPRGVYFLTVKEHDGPNDRASRLDRDGVYRLNIGVGTAAYVRLFGPKPARPSKGGVVATGHDFTERDVLLPHPVYAWMGWVCVLSPSAETFERVKPLIDEAHRLAATTFDQRR